MKAISNYYHTLKHLKAEQILHRLVRKMSRPRARQLSLLPAELTRGWTVQTLGEQAIFNDRDVRFLNLPGSVWEPADWNTSARSKLWLYNLHYFDDLVAKESATRRDLHRVWMHRWVEDNPVSHGNGWEPYPNSLRIVNWIKAFLQGLEPSQTLLDSLAQQLDYLSRDLEKHLLGNHLFVNTKALIFGGCFFEGKEADRWLETGLELYRRELAEQVLEDGGNFELTPMYHAIMLVDLLDLVNLFRTYAGRIDEATVNVTTATAEKMLGWLEEMTHRDGDISFFNDSTLGIAPDNDTIFEYARSLGMTARYAGRSLGSSVRASDLFASGYVSVQAGDMSLIADLATIGPDYIPGHAHADTLSFELSLGQERIFVNSGISRYGADSERLRQRKTPAHNTVSINGMDSSEVWGGFRVARRAYITERSVQELADGTVEFSAAHNGFVNQGLDCVHARKWTVSDDHCVIADQLIGNFREADAYLHLHPTVKIIEFDNQFVELESGSWLIRLTAKEGLFDVQSSSYHPAFSVSQANQKLVIKFKGPEMKTKITWEKK